MKYSIAISAFAALSSLAIAQSGGGQAGSPASIAAFRPVAPVQAARPVQSRPASGFGSNTGWGSVVNPGTGHPPNTTPGGLPKTGVYGRTGRQNGRGTYTGNFAFAYPTYIPGYYDSVTANPQDQLQYAPQYSNQGDYYQGGQSDRPTVVIQNFYPSNAAQQQAGPGMVDPGDSNMQTYRAPYTTPADSAVNSGNYYLIALKDHHVYSALAYWTEGSTFHYVTTQNTHNQAPFDSVDVEMMKRLNQDSNMNLTSSGR